MLKTILKSKYLKLLLLTMAAFIVVAGLLLSEAASAGAEADKAREDEGTVLNEDGDVLINYQSEDGSEKLKVKDSEGNVIYEADSFAEEWFDSEGHCLWLYGSGEIVDYKTGEVKNILDHDFWFCSGREYSGYLGFDGEYVYTFRLCDSLTQPIYTFMGEDFQSLAQGMVLAGRYGTDKNYLYGTRIIGMDADDGKEILSLCESHNDKWVPEDTAAILIDFEGNILYESRDTEIMGLNGDNLVVRKAGGKATREIPLAELAQNPVREV